MRLQAQLISNQHCQVFLADSLNDGPLRVQDRHMGLSTVFRRLRQLALKRWGHLFFAQQD